MLPSCYETLAEAIRTTIQREFRVPTNLFILYARDHSIKIYGLLSSFFSAWPFDQKLGSALIYFFICTRPFVKSIWSFILSFVHDHSTKIRVHTDLFLLFAHDHSTKIYEFFISFILPLCTTIRPKFRVLINLFFLFVHDHSTKSEVTLTLLFILFLDVPIFCLLYSWQILPLYFHRSVSGSTALILRLLYL